MFRNNKNLKDRVRNHTIYIHVCKLIIQMQPAALPLEPPGDPSTGE